MREILNLSFKAPGPVSRAFYLDRSPIAAIMGPIGSAKTSTALMKIVGTAMRVPRSSRDGTRYCRAVVLRDTYRRMRRTTLETWRKRVPSNIGKFTEGGDNAPSVHRIQFVHPQDRSTIDLEIVFAAVGDNDVEEFCKGFEITCGFASELTGMSRELPYWLFSRTGRYPDDTHVDLRELDALRQVWFDFNAPDVDHWVYDDFVGNAASTNYKLFRQPGGLEPNAENLMHLTPGYYQKMLESGSPQWWIDRNVHNKFGASREGKPVYPEFNDALHVAASPILPVRGIKLIVGADAGGTPAATIRQHMPDGQQRVLAEIATDPAQNTGPTRFGQILNELLLEKFPEWAAGGAHAIDAWCDPAAIYGDSETGEGAWAAIVSRVVGVRFRPARTNDPTKRQEAVRAPMTRMIDGVKPGLWISPACKTLRRAYNSGFRFMKKSGGAGEYHAHVEKNQWSHVADADQYGALAGAAVLAVERDARARADGARPFNAPTDFSLFE
jgi:hypothetical protein